MRWRVRGWTHRLACVAVVALLATLTTLSLGPTFVDASTSAYIAPNADTTIPVYDTAWQMFARATPAEADEYFEALEARGFSGTWAGVIHHAPATWAHSYRDGGQIGWLSESGELVLDPGYRQRVADILDAADEHSMKVGLVAAWQNLYAPGGGADAGNPISNIVRGSIDTGNARAWGEYIVQEFGDHPAVSMWVLGGDAGTNNTEANKAVWREMAAGIRDAGSTLDITYHTPTSPFDQLNYAGEPWLDFISPETGHGQDADETRAELIAAGAAYGLPVWQGESRYFNINFNWVPAAFRNPGVPEVEADAIAARDAGVAGYVYGDAGRWHWCNNFGDSSPCDRTNIAASFGLGEDAVVDVFRAPDSEAPDSAIDDLVGAVEGAVTVSGTATDDSSGVVRVRVRVRRDADGMYWNGTSWVSIANTWLAADGTESWSLADVPVVEGDYVVRAYAVDASGTVERWVDGRPSMSFSVASMLVDEVAPNTVIDGAVPDSGDVVVSGTATDADSDVLRVRVRVRRNSDGLYWNGAAWVSIANTWLTADGTEVWSLDGVPAIDGSYTATAYAIDTEFNVEKWLDGRPMFTFTLP